MDRSRLVKKLVFWKDKHLTKGAITRFIVLALIVLVLTPFLLVLVIRNDYQSKIIANPNDLSRYRVAIVFGASVSDDGPSEALQERIQTAVNLYKSGKIEKIIMSGDNQTPAYDEPSSMIDKAISLGVPSSALQPDFAGRRTYDTCYRAKNVFNLGRAVLISQQMHLLRALYICNSLGVNSVGVVATGGGNFQEDSVRETLAFLKALWDVNVSPPQDVVLGPAIAI